MDSIRAVFWKDSRTEEQISIAIGCSSGFFFGVGTFDKSQKKSRCKGEGDCGTNHWNVAEDVHDISHEIKGRRLTPNQDRGHSTMLAEIRHVRELPAVKKGMPQALEENNTRSQFHILR